ncbi:carboxy-S-adenosyl-L-methionine synthase CmoA [Salinisphaera hydrothermalis]|uniref:Carboxy-S-adenosyl-L-methionine synthase n=1 Tax=Salinisphaera hydrothermalis (strain C41B8) TaxID=1304275 RepID=A0A084IMS3_SALHC|nr:carboxy-S-adenosyl-L-methionine synthase CmoA [Salinisphaera hydrothermalis]KEZ78007.1 methyltransferase [Salinisphaera hydrothermalis C41B8]
MTPTDRVFDEEWRPSDFAFDAHVAGVFDDMVSRSVPFYDEVQRMQTELAVSLLPDGDSLVYDLGCSTATTLAAIAGHRGCPAGARFVGIDNAPDMLDRAGEKIAERGLSDRIDLIHGELNGSLALSSCDMVIMNWTLQFVRPVAREALVRAIAAALRPGGVLFLSEKILVGDSLLNRLYIEFYYDYKRNRGYSDTEIRNKREALENVLVPYRSDENHDLLRHCGFASVDSFFRWYNFESLVAVKGDPRRD